MAFGVNRKELIQWKELVRQGEIAFLTHYWQDKRFPGCYTVTKVGCINIAKLVSWGNTHGLKERWIHYDIRYPHFDLFGSKQKEILLREQQWDHIKRFNL